MSNVNAAGWTTLLADVDADPDELAYVETQCVESVTYELEFEDAEAPPPAVTLDEAELAIVRRALRNHVAVLRAVDSLLEADEFANLERTLATRAGA